MGPTKFVTWSISAADGRPAMAGALRGGRDQGLTLALAFYPAMEDLPQAAGCGSAHGSWLGFLIDPPGDRPRPPDDPGARQLMAV
jgi:hypothetical protein